jgi:5-methylcytosine-specific restriction protein A
VLTRDAFACVDCGRIDQANHADHVVAISQGGERYDVGNGQTLCVRCHARKTLRETRVPNRQV